jgi:hypothetical protein
VTVLVFASGGGGIPYEPPPVPAPPAQTPPSPPPGQGNGGGNGTLEQHSGAGDVTPPNVLLDQALDGRAFSDSTPSISAVFTDDGGIDPARTVILLDGLPFADAVASAAGFSLTPTHPLADGPHILTVTVVDRAGNVRSASWSFSIDTGKPFVTIVQPTDGARITAVPNALRALFNDALSGIDASSVRMRLDGVQVAAVAKDGAVTFAPPASLAKGKHTLEVTVLDAAGNLGTATSSFTLQPANTPGLPVGAFVLALAAVALAWGRRRGPPPA